MYFVVYFCHEVLMKLYSYLILSFYRGYTGLLVVDAIDEHLLVQTPSNMFNPALISALTVHN